MKKLLLLFLLFLPLTACSQKTNDGASTGAIQAGEGKDKEYIYEDKDQNKYQYSVLDEREREICIHYIYAKTPEVKVPSQIGEYRVIRVGQYICEVDENFAVDVNNNIQSLKFSPGIKEIGDRAFVDNKGMLQEVDLGTVEKIGEDAFAGNPEMELEKNYASPLSTITWSNSLREIGNGAFYRASIKELSLPKRVYLVGENAFSKCEKLAKVKIVNPAVELKDFAFGSSAITDLQLPEQLTGKIGMDCFCNTKIQTLKWPELQEKDSKNIGVGAFSRCKNLQKVIFPEKQKHIYIANGVFGECKKLKNLTFPETTEKVTYRTNLYADNYPHSCKSLTILGKDTVLKGIKIGTGEGELLTVGKVIAPAGSLALQYAKKAKRIVKISEKILKDKEWGGDGDLLPEYYMEKGQVIYGKMRTQTGDGKDSPERQKDSLQQKCKKIKGEEIDVELPSLLYASESVAVILDESSIIVYNLTERTVSDIVLLKGNDKIGDIFLQGDKASRVYADADGKYIYIREIRGNNHYQYELGTGKIKKIKKIEDKTFFDSYIPVLKSQYLAGEGEAWHLCGDTGIQIGEKDFLYLINKSFKTLEGLTLVRCGENDKAEIPVWD